MNLTFSKTWMLLPGVILLIVGGLVAHTLEGAAISYPTDVWRMDLDDIIANIGTVLLGVGTLLLGFAALIKAREALSISRRNEHSLNGGMAETASEHVNTALQEADVEQGLWRRVDVLTEQQRECEEREKRADARAENCEARNEELREWVIARLDGSDKGRNVDRASTA